MSLPAFHPLMQFTTIAAVLFSLWGFSRAKVITVPAEDPSILLDQYFKQASDAPPGCEGTYLTQVPNSYALFNFTGTAVDVIGSTSSRGGAYDIYFDSKIQATIDRYAPSSKLQCPLVTFSRSGLPYIQHSLLMVFRGNSTQHLPESGSGYMDLAAIQYTIPDIDDSQDEGSEGKDVAAVIGGAVGGGVGLALIVALIWYVASRKRRGNAELVTHDVGESRTEKPKWPPPASPSFGFASTSLAYPQTSPPFAYGPSGLPQGARASDFPHVYSTPPAGMTNPVRNSFSHPSEITPFDPRFQSPPLPDGRAMMTGYMPNQMAAPQPHRTEERQSVGQGILDRSLTTRTFPAPPAYE
ncbi:hypothetical protein FRC03_009578 [Tulasnella sp. 419]|nr:hypothetical protein FRC03_009578 [Tulasnella sp. 419]